MLFATANSIKKDPVSAITDAYETLVEKLEGEPDILFLHTTETYDGVKVNEKLRELAGSNPVHGGTSCQGIMTDDGMVGGDGHALALMGISDPEGAYGVGAAEIGDDPKSAAGDALQLALSNAKRPGQMPQMIWLMAAPGMEEEFITGIQTLLGPDVPVFGGSSADNEVAGRWSQFANGEVYSNAVVIGAVFSSAEIVYSFHSGYEPTSKRGTVTRAEGRTLYEIDGKPAAIVYNEWSGGAISEELESGGNILGKTTLSPLGRIVGSIEGTPYFQLSHPDGLVDGEALTLFTGIEEGEELICMTGTKDSLISRAGRVAQAALDSSLSSDKQVLGSLVIYCAGCMLTVQDRIEEVAEEIGGVFDQKPFLGTFTFGEQGCFVGGENRHGNLMISAVSFLG